jgi:hypothetical protein
MVVNCWFLYMDAMYSWFISLATALCYGSISKLREDNGLFLLMSTTAHPSNLHQILFFPFSYNFLLFHIIDMLFKTSFQFFHIILYNVNSLCPYKHAFQLLSYSVATFVQVLSVTFFSVKTLCTMLKVFVTFWIFPLFTWCYQLKVFIRIYKFVIFFWKLYQHPNNLFVKFYGPLYSLLLLLFVILCDSLLYHVFN